MIYERHGVYISAKIISIGEDVSFGTNVDIRCIDKFTLGDRSHLGDDVRIRGRSVVIGTDLYHSRGLDVGGGGCDRPRSTLRIGDRCTIHNNHINLAESVVIGDDVGLSPDVVIECHGFWWSVLEGFPTVFKGVTIGNGAIIGYRTIIMPGVNIGEFCVVGAQSVVTKDLPARSVCVGSPCKKIKDIVEPSFPYKKRWVEHIVAEYMKIAKYHGIHPIIHVRYPKVIVNDCVFDMEHMAFEGKEDECSDDWRDHARRYGIRFYSERPFRSALKWE